MRPTCDQLTGWYTVSQGAEESPSAAVFFPNQTLSLHIYTTSKYDLRDDVVTWAWGPYWTYVLNEFDYDEAGNLTGAAGYYYSQGSPHYPITMTRFASFGSGTVPPGTVVKGTFEGVVTQPE